jgi:hypothetical protein
MVLFFSRDRVGVDAAGFSEFTSRASASEADATNELMLIRSFAAAEVISACSSGV